MGEYESNVDLQQAAGLIRKAATVAVCTHAKPDGDAFGSVIALTATLRGLGIDATASLMMPIPGHFRHLRGWELVTTYEPSVGLGQPDLLVLLDTGAWSQTAPMRRELEGLLDRTLIIDHHLSGDVPARWRHIDGQAAACCEVVAALVERLEGNRLKETGQINPVVADALFVGLASDTGWFRFSNTRPQTLRWAARLLESGVNHAELYGQIEQTERPQKLKLLTRALDGLRLIADDRVALMVLTSDDFEQAGALLEETERFVDVPQMVSSVQVVVLITQVPPAPAPGGGPADSGRGPEIAKTFEPDRDPPVSQSRPADLAVARGSDSSDVVRLSFRSKPGPDAVNVAKLAQQFGGGGHARAAGAQVAAPLESVIEDVCRATSDAVSGDRRP